MLLSERFSPITFDLWFSDCSLAELTLTEAYIYTPSSYKRPSIELNYTHVLREIFKSLMGGEIDVFILDENGLNARRVAAENKPQEPEETDYYYTFERFVVGSSNKFAHAAARAVASGESGREFNPLFIYGPSGVGKTHLLKAIQNEIRAAHPDYTITYVQGDDFLNDMVWSIDNKKNFEFRGKYRNSHVFLMDDVQFIAGRKELQVEFFNTFETLYAAERQIVLASDRPPRDMPLLDDRLRTRFEGTGLMADIQPPDFETRMAIILNKSRELGLLITNEIAAYMADNMSANVRQLEGAVRKILVHAQIHNDTELTVEEVSKRIQDLIHENEKKITTELVVDQTAKRYGITSDDILGQSRSRNIALPRQVAQYLMRTLTSMPLTTIGKEFNRDHTTIMNSLSNVENGVKNDAELALAVKDITENIRAIVDNS